MAAHKKTKYIIHCTRYCNEIRKVLIKYETLLDVLLNQNICRATAFLSDIFEQSTEANEIDTPVSIEHADCLIGDILTS